MGCCWAVVVSNMLSGVPSMLWGHFMGSLQLSRQFCLSLVTTFCENVPCGFSGIENLALRFTSLSIAPREFCSGYCCCTGFCGSLCWTFPCCCCCRILWNLLSVASCAFYWALLSRMAFHSSLSACCSLAVALVVEVVPFFLCNLGALGYQWTCVTPLMAFVIESSFWMHIKVLNKGDI